MVGSHEGIIHEEAFGIGSIRHKDLAIDHRKALAGKDDNALDIVYGRVVRIFEDDNVAALGCPKIIG
jgi:hypothetical protein